MAQKKKVLIVDDDEDILEALELSFQSEGYSTKTLAKGKLVYKTAERFKPHAIVLDVLLSGEDGRDICKKLKANSKTKHTPVIMISAYPDPQSSVFSAGANDFIAKPFDIRDLIKTVDKYVV